MHLSDTLEMLACSVPLIVLIVLSTMWSRLRRIEGLSDEVASQRATLDDLVARIAWLEIRLSRGVQAEKEMPADALARAGSVAEMLDEPAAAPAPIAAEQPSQRIALPTPTTGFEAPPVGTHPPPRLADPAHEPSSQSPPPIPPGAGWRVLEENLGARLPVWIGSIALALAGAFLVKYTVDQGLLGPTVRVTLGVAFGVVLLGIAEFARARASRIAAGLSAAGIAVLFASLLAGVNSYRLIPPSLGFALLGLTAAAAVALSLRHGQIIAIVGLVGGFMTPILIGSEEPGSPWPVFGYLLLLQLGLLVVTRRRRWAGLAVATLIAGAAWVALWIADGGSPSDNLVLGAFTLASVGSFLITATRVPGGAWGSTGGTSMVGWAAVVLGHLMLATVLAHASFSPVEWAFLALLSASTLELARRDVTYFPAAVLSAGFVGLLVMLWRLGPDPRTPVLVLAVSSGLAALYTASGILGITTTRQGPRWAALAGVAAIGFFLSGYTVLYGSRPPMPWGGLAILWAAVFVASTAYLAPRRQKLEGGTLVIAILAATATGFVSLAVPLELDRYWLAVAWALEVPALVWIARRLDAPPLMRLVLPLALLAVVRLIAVPSLSTGADIEAKLALWYLYGFGVPVAAFVVAALELRRRPPSGAQAARPIGTAPTVSQESPAPPVSLTVAGQLIHEWLFAAAAALGFYLLVLELMLAVDLWVPDAAAILVRWAVFVVAAQLYAAALARISDRANAPILYRAALVAFGLGICSLFLGPLLTANPVVAHIAVGSLPILNTLLLAYAVPAALALIIAPRIAPTGWASGWNGAAQGIALLLLFAYVSFEVRHGFHGTYLDGGSLTAMERYAYSLAWILFGTALLGVGIVYRNRIARYASLAVMMLSVAKVFLYDLAVLTGLYRVVSFLGLGVSMLLLAYLYQRFVFNDRTNSPQGQ